MLDKFGKYDTRHRANILLISISIVLVTALSLHSTNIPRQNDVTDAPHARSVEENKGLNSDYTYQPLVVPPALQKGFLR